MKRASIEQNFHVLYSNFLDCLKIKEFYKLIITETYRNIRVRKNADLVQSRLSEKVTTIRFIHILGALEKR